MSEIVDVYLHWQAGRSIKAIARSLGIDRKTVRKYVSAATEGGFRPGDQRSTEQWAAFVRDRFPKVMEPRERSQWFAKLDEYSEFIREGLANNRMSTVHRRLVERTGLGLSVATFRRYVHVAMPELLRTDAVPIWRPEVPPGEEAQVDFGYLGRWNDPVTAKTHRIYTFVLVLSYSRHMFVRPVRRLDGRAWQDCHVKALEFFGAVPRRVVVDNLKDGVVKPDLYDPTLNKAYAELAAHYGFLIDPARQGRPKDKPRVERPMVYIRDSFWRGERFLSLEAMTRGAVDWSLRVAGMRIHGTTYRRPLEAFEAEDKPAMLPLPEERFEPCTWTTAKVGPDAHCSVGGRLYSIPHEMRGRRLGVRLTDSLVHFFWDGELVKTHERSMVRGRTTDPADLPPDRVAFYEHAPQWCLSQARDMGLNVLEAIRQVLAVQTLTHLRQAQGIVRLAQTYGADRLDAACARALAFGDPGYRTVKRILVNGFDLQPLPGMARETRAGAYLRGVRAFSIEPSGGGQHACARVGTDSEEAQVEWHPGDDGATSRTSQT